MARNIQVTPEQLESAAGRIEGLAGEYKAPARRNVFHITYLTAILSISTKAPLGSAFTANAERAGKSPSK